MAKRPITDDVVVQIYILKGSGRNWDEIAKELDISYEAIKYPGRRPARNYIHFFTSHHRSLKETALFLGIPLNDDTKVNVKKELQALDLIGIRVFHRDNNYYMKMPQYASNHIFEFESSPNIAIVSDTHIGSKHTRLDYLTDFYNIAVNEYGITHFFHAGDLTDGVGVYRGHEFEVDYHGFEEQKRAVIEQYPYIPGTVTHIVSGNHDMSFHDKQGAHIVNAVCQERDDFHFLGDYGAFFMINGFKVYILHQKMGMAYAQSYPAQRIMQGLYGDMKPNLLILGHLHSLVSLNIQDTEIIQCDSFQDPTDLAIRKAYPHNISGVILNINSLKVDEDHKQRFTYEKIRYGVGENKLLTER